MIHYLAKRVLEAEMVEQDGLIIRKLSGKARRSTSESGRVLSVKTDQSVELQKNGTNDIQSLLAFSIQIYFIFLISPFRFMNNSVITCCKTIIMYRC